MRPGTGDWGDAVAESVTSGRSVRVGDVLRRCRPGRYRARRYPGPARRRRVARPRRAPHPRARRHGHRTGPALRPHRRRDREPARAASCSSDLFDGKAGDPGLRERARHQHVVLDAPLAVAVAATDGIDRYAAVRALARLAGTGRGLVGEYHGTVVLLVSADDPLAVGERGAIRPRAGRRAGDRGRGRRERRRPPAGVRRGAALPRHVADARPVRRGQRPGRAGSGPAAAGGERT